MDSEKRLVSGKVSRVIGGMEGGQPLCNFRIGSIPCRAHAGLALQIISHRGYPENEVAVEGVLVEEGKKKTLDISELSVIM
jgi:hypothetical protein